MDNQGPNNYNYNNGPGNNGSGGNGNNGGNRPGGNGGRNNRGGQGIMAFILLTLVALFVYALISNSISHASTQEKSYSDFIKQLDKGNVKSVEFDSYEIDYKLVDDGHKDYDITYYTGRVADDELVPTLKKAKTSEGKSIEIKAAIPDNTSTWIFNILSFIVPLILLWVLLAFVSKKMGGSMGMGVGKSTAKVYVEKSTGVNFKDVAGQDEAKESLQEVVDFLHNPKRYTDIGAKLPKGALLVGPPGTGKTLLAKAVAGEAGVPFFSLAGSDFVEMFIGVGASRVRDLFKEAQKMAPCIIFIDEIDAIGKSRDSRYGGGNDEREQTLNQLLAEMDGFDTSKGLLILAATNRPEVLDKALLRPGRFDRRIIVDKPDLKGRLETLKVHSKDVKMDESVDLDALALATAGLVGSDLANMINEAAINAVKNGRQLVNQSDLFEAFELVAVGGKEKKDRVMSDKERKIVSYHEVGHALVSALQKNTEPVQKITIVPRTMGALGYTLQTPEEEKYLETKDELLAKITTYMAGRAAEVLVFNSVTSGAANDIENATKIARAMVTMYGMSDKFGMMCLATVQNQYLEGGAGLICGENTASQIDDEVLSIINSSYAEAMKLLDENREILDSISDYLYEKETITGKEFMKMFRDMKGLPDPDEEKDGEESKEHENAQNDAQKDTTSAADPLLRNATDQPADTNESSGYTAPDDTSNN
ncbi:ATP-dependent zinc metalloprotease FtsH [Agathobacter rectalis]|uniref:ATP-dependent zinc metalloprotease FtsH n=1 Tax=Agathobacter rectalis TaxID=39491 RepID=A0AAW4WIU6_9FIRM|nr:ATP-dependent zinc metalloprotease FtsH [Agathobacter rectalis]MCC2746568.1 ATP-dependent zinc metalloprotease FtsH [Agathobacter rectalis]NSI35071.1 ATP-dependent zinc metalloprotease FtsH [Agathobacter rectalis]NSI38343.1 ATP-dependent zinc metalloprotease FtsH [Agathobacter rectalis]NSI67694.1 ATP-dependent zinc metalloprotease FtsH [Agathobacter rectalis]NSI73688.1 ATP-dependent zinc metalloprotease FtsH [Agathobacter rectalis]